MRPYLVGVPLLGVVAVLQSTVLPHLRLYDASIDLMLLVVLGWTQGGDWQNGVMWGFIGGLALDLLSGGPLGGQTLGLVLLAYLASLAEGRLWRSHVVLPLGTVLLCTPVYHLLNMLLLSATLHPVDWGLSLGRVILPATLLNTLCALPAYYLLHWLYEWVHPPAVSV